MDRCEKSADALRAALAEADEPVATLKGYEPKSAATERLVYVYEPEKNAWYLDGIPVERAPHLPRREPLTDEVISASPEQPGLVVGGDE